MALRLSGESKATCRKMSESTSAGQPSNVAVLVRDAYLPGRRTAHGDKKRASTRVECVDCGRAARAACARVADVHSLKVELLRVARAAERTKARRFVSSFARRRRVSGAARSAVPLWLASSRPLPARRLSWSNAKLPRSRCRPCSSRRPASCGSRRRFRSRSSRRSRICWQSRRPTASPLLRPTTVRR